MSHRDPTANMAIKRADRGRAREVPQRRIVAEFPEIFAGLTDRQMRDVALLARSLAGNNTWAIQERHLLEARTRVGVPERRAGEATAW